MTTNNDSEMAHDESSNEAIGSDHRQARKPTARGLKPDNKGPSEQGKNGTAEGSRRSETLELLKFVWWNDECMSVGPVLLIASFVALALWVVT